MSGKRRVLEGYDHDIWAQIKRVDGVTKGAEGS
jgi:hypothetical protein